MAISSVSAGTNIDPAWGNAVAAAINNNEGAWTSYTPTFTNVTGGVCTAYYRLVGKTVDIRVVMSAGSATAAGSIQISLPAGMAAAGTHVVPATRTNAALILALASAAGSTTITVYQDANGANWSAGGTVQYVRLTGRIEIQ